MFRGAFYKAPFLFNEVTKNLKSAFPDFVKKNLKSAKAAEGSLFNEVTTFFIYH